MPCFTLSQGNCSVQPLSTTTGPEPLHWDRPGLSSLLKGFSLVVTDGGKNMPCSFSCLDNTSGDLGMQWKHKGSGFITNILKLICVQFNSKLSLCPDPDFKEKYQLAHLLSVSAACMCCSSRLRHKYLRLNYCDILLNIFIW